MVSIIFAAAFYTAVNCTVFRGKVRASEPDYRRRPGHERST
jgi:hypothetical protein